MYIVCDSNYCTYHLKRGLQKSLEKNGFSGFVSLFYSRYGLYRRAVLLGIAGHEYVGQKPDTSAVARDHMSLTTVGTP